MSARPHKVRIAGADAASFLAAAHAMTELALVVVDKAGRAWTAALAPRPGAPKADLAAEFRALYAAQKLRADLLRAGAPLRAERLRRALAGDAAAAPGGASPALSPERLAEIEALLAEEAAAPAAAGDPLGAKGFWEDRKG